MTLGFLPIKPRPGLAAGGVFIFSLDFAKPLNSFWLNQGFGA